MVIKMFAGQLFKYFLTSENWELFISLKRWMQCYPLNQSDILFVLKSTVLVYRDTITKIQSLSKYVWTCRFQLQLNCFFYINIQFSSLYTPLFLHESSTWYLAFDILLCIKYVISVASLEQNYIKIKNQNHKSRCSRSV